MDIIRPAALSDVEGMSVVVDSAWRENYKDIFSPEQIDAYTGEHRRKSFTALLNNGKDVSVLVHGDEVAAVCAVQEYEETPFESYAEILLMYVHPRFQHMGMGSKLLSHTLRQICDNGFKGAILSTAEKNGSARCFYKKLGFTERSSREFDGVVYITYTIEL